ncbi:hypothetical protein FRUB_10056 [Fimbriiglobus ruber]|uniref:Uncharacterized protein n=1 Tax=Fimbriiglobus ruber TaxID=1908690 RepID=A0A225D6E1_9BACT|nr:hypothetical protein FRUB_10056 [Fimbriiglobus ruber]
MPLLAEQSFTGSAEFLGGHAGSDSLDGTCSSTFMLKWRFLP